VIDVDVEAHGLCETKLLYFSRQPEPEMLVRRLPLLLLGALLVLSGCRRKVSVGSPPATQPGAAATTGVGGATARDAVERFMAAARQGNLDAMSQIWGSTAGPVRATMSRQEWEMREVVFMRCLRHETWRVLGESPAAGGERLMSVEIKFRDLTRSTNFYAVMGPEQRWFIRQFDMEPLTSICQRPL
jgi:hypothetical protein